MTIYATEPNARFWELINSSPVKLTLYPGQRISKSSYQSTEEGYYSEAYTWEHAFERVECKAIFQSKDCDGRFDSVCESTCEISALRAGEVDILGDCDLNGRPIVWPAWTLKGSSQRDHSAEAMGY